MEFRAVVEIRLGAVLNGRADLAGSETPAGPADTPDLALPAKLAFVVTASLLFPLLVYAIFTRAVWYDEFYTYYVARPDVGWIEALKRHWLTDNHPPLYYALVRATSWLGGSLEARRIVNLLIAVAAFVGGIGAVKASNRGVSQRYLLAIAYFLFLAAQDAAFPLVGELRSYFLSFCSIALLVLLAALIWTDTDVPRGRSKILLWL